MKTPRVISHLASAGLLLCAVNPAEAGAQDNPQMAESNSLQRCLRVLADQESFSGVISVTQAGRPMALIARGVLAGPDSPPITATTRFNLGSASKMFTAVAVGQLVDAGKVKFDDPIGKYVAGLTPEASVVTVRQLLTHSSGLGDFFEPQNMEAMLKARTASDILPLIAGDKPSFPPGSKFRYSNSGFALLGVLIERVSGHSYGEYLRSHVFNAAGMSHTGLDPEPLATLAVGMTSMHPGVESEKPAPLAGTAGPSAPSAERVLIGPEGQSIAGATTNSRGGAPTSELRLAPGATQGYGSPAGGLFSTVTDMQRFATALMSSKLTTAATTAALIAPQIIAAPATETQPQRTYGLGFGVGDVAGKRWFGHNGGTLGANVEFAVFPDQQLTFTVLANRDPPLATVTFKYLEGLIFKKQFCSLHSS